ncbi:Hsp70 family protein [Dactylosporangium salmoneum]
MLGIDFGTSSTVAVVGLADGRAVPLLFGETPLLPSAVGVTAGGELVVGRDAVRASRSRPEAFEAHPKSRIDDGEVLLGERAVPVADLIGAVLRRVHDEAVRVAGAAVDRLVLTHPAGWGARRRQTLQEAATVAGLPPAVLVAEPVAAAAYYVHVLGHVVPVGGCLVVYDFGAGTFDASVVRRTAGGFEVLAEQGIVDAGGLDVDAAIVAHLGATYGVRDPEGWHRLTAPATSADRRTLRTFWDDVRTGKEELSRTSMTTIFVPILDLDTVLGREQLDHLARPLLDRTVAATRLAVRNAGVGAEQVAAVFLVGGSSRMSLPATLLHRSLGVAPTVIEQPELIVAGGTLHLDGAAPRTAEPPLHHDELASVPHESLSLAVAEQPMPPAPALPDPSTSTPLTARSAAETIDTPQADEGGPGTAAPARGPRRLLVAAAAILAIVVVVVVIALRFEPPAAGPTATKSSGNAPTSPLASAAASAVVTPTSNLTRLATLTDHKGAVESVAFSPDGKTMATAGDDNTVMVWNVADPAAPVRIATLTEHKDTVAAVAFSRDGKNMATASFDGTVMVWNMGNPAAPAHIATLTDHVHWVYSVAFSSDGKTMATAGGDFSVMVWKMTNPAAPARIATLTDYSDAALSVAFSPDGKTMATAGGAGNTVKMWNMADPAAPARVATLTDHKSRVRSVAFSPVGKIMATAGGDDTVLVWNVTDPAAPARIATLTDHKGEVYSVAFSSDGKTMATAGADHTVLVWNMTDPAAPSRIATLTDRASAVNSVAFSPVSKTMATAGGDHTAIVWRLPAT